MPFPFPEQIFTLRVTTLFVHYPLFAVYAPVDQLWAVRQIALKAGLDPERTLGSFEGEPPTDVLILRQYADLDWMIPLWL